ncbi:MAG: UDP-glucose/GDP-mannose dehydrogenase family protein [Candidatus Andersenbacteria bacterium]
MRITVIGAGAVGLVTALGFAAHGHAVTCLDRSPGKVARLNGGEPTIFEPGLAVLLRAGRRTRHVRFTTDERVVTRARLIFVTVGTPQGTNGAADLRQIWAVARQLGRLLRGRGRSRTTIVIKSTVPVGTGDAFAARLRRAGVRADVVSNPEFLRQGSAVQDVLKPDRVVLGAEDPTALAPLLRAYAGFVPRARILTMSRPSAELTKYASNAFLAAKISFMNELARYATSSAADIDEVRQGMGTDRRIGPYFLNAGVGYGGSCFPKDVSALTFDARRRGVDLSILRAVASINRSQHTVLLDALLRHLHRTRRAGALRGVTVAVWGLAFKPNTDDLRSAPSREIVRELLRLGATVRAYDPHAMARAEREYPAGITYAADAYGAARGARAVVLVTEWDEFKRVRWPRVRRAMRARPIVLDGRNLYDPAALRRAGFAYRGIGRGRDAA